MTLRPEMVGLAALLTRTVDPATPVAGGSTKATVAAVRSDACVPVRAASYSASSSPGKAARSSAAVHPRV